MSRALDFLAAGHAAVAVVPARWAIRLVLVLGRVAVAEERVSADGLFWRLVEEAALAACWPYFLDE